MAGGRCAGDYLPYLKHTEPVPVAGLSRRHPDFCVYRFASVFVAERETFTADEQQKRHSARPVASGA
jgi:hypothetical protein